MTNTVFCMIKDCGDGSNTLVWFDGHEVILEELMDLIDCDPQTWGSGGVDAFNFPEGFDFTLAGIFFTKIEEIELDLNAE